MLNQGIIRFRAVIEIGALFGYFFDKQKVTKETAAAINYQIVM
jgi:hypothetical protein